MKYSTFSLEYSLLQFGLTNIAGMDEVGRGCLAGPVVAAIVIVSSDSQYIKGVTDSKLMTASNRECMYKEIVQISDAYGIGKASFDEIDNLGIQSATSLAMLRAYEQLKIRPDIVLIDGRNTGFYRCANYKIDKGDQKHYVISAASVIAKVYRDRLMHDIAKKYCGYGFESNVGYGTEQHRDAIKKLGVCPIHRRSFSPIKQIV